MGLEPTTTGITILDSTIELQSPYRNTLRNLTVLPDTWHCMAKTETESDNSLTFADLPWAHRSTSVFLYMVGLPGFEPGPGGLKVRCAKPLTLQSHIGP